MLINNIRKSPTFPIRNTIHAPTRGATTKTGHIPVLGNFQSTLLQEERPEDIIGLVCNMWLSIHAPTRGATLQHGAEHLRITLSIHAPTRGATRKTQTKHYARHFQSTLLQEERRNGMVTKMKNEILSIHAPTRGATTETKYTRSSNHLSIHAPTRGATWAPKVSALALDLSIHAPTRGATSRFFNAASRFSTFNPRSYKRSDRRIVVIPSV